MGLLEKIFGSYSKRELKHINPIMNKVLDLDKKYTEMSDEDLKGQTSIFKERLSNGESVDDILPDAFATCREVSYRVLGMKHFPVQIIGGIVLHQGRIAEMKTGEGKTLVATLPTYLNALTGKGVHIVTVNDYLAKRDSEWMGKIFKFLGMTVGLITNSIPQHMRQSQYNCDIIYATNNELGFDYLRDNMCIYSSHKVQRGFNFAVIDEVDSILVDEARTPLIISGQGDKSTDLYVVADKFAKTLKMHKVAELDDKIDNDNIDADYIVDEKAKTATLTPSGVKKAENYFLLDNLMDADNISTLHHINQSIRANSIMKNEIDYVINNGEIVIVDEFTGRLMIGRRYNEGLHQAIEAKEGVTVERESKTLATITFQNLFRIYTKLSGMTGTAMTEEGEFREIYKLDVIEIPTNKPIKRSDHDDVIFKTLNAKNESIIQKIIDCNKKGQPILVGTISIEDSEKISRMLKVKKIPHNVLNAKYHDKEAEIIAQAGKFGSVTIATNMAGRGTDIVLGGNADFLSNSELLKRGYKQSQIDIINSFIETDDEEIIEGRKIYKEFSEKFKKEIKIEADKVREAGGLYILGTERHESRRIDNQLRGRAGRQGDLGESCFFLSLEDDIMRLFGGEKVKNIMNVLKIDESQPIENKILTNSIESAQRKVEGRNFGIRKNVLQFDDVMNKQREIIYSQREKVLNGENLKDYILSMVKDSISSTVQQYIANTDIKDDWNIVGLKDHYLGFLTTNDDLNITKEELEDITKESITKMLTDKAIALYELKELEAPSSETLREIERVILLKNVDTKWMDHIDAMDELKKGIYLRAYGQKNPVVEYRLEGFDMFDEMIESIKSDTTRILLSLSIKPKEEIVREPVVINTKENIGDIEKTPIQIPITSDKTGRNDDCPCGSGNKYKKCCGK